MSIPLVSVLIPLYNSEKYIAETIESCLNQTYKNIEIIIVDDGSTDNSYQIAQSYESDILKVYQQENAGACRARNYAFELSKGDYIQYLDADDLLSPNKIEEQVKLFEQYGDDIIANCTWVRFYKEIDDGCYEKRQIDHDYENPVDWLIDSWSGKGFGADCSWLTSREIILKAGIWNESLCKNQDGEFFCRVLLQSKGIKFCNEVLVYYRNSGETSIGRDKSYNACLSTINSFHWYEKYVGNISNEKLKRALAYNYSFFYYYCYPDFPDLLATAKLYSKSLGFKNLLILPHSSFSLKLASKIIGFENSIKLANTIKRFIKK